jgi:2-amino-4-hydroxy-6-hydroxymethyldihydropteridine diphosphokinase
MRIGIALGSNLDDRLALLRSARKRIQSLHEDSGPFLCSRIYETAPADCPPGSPLFLNAALEMSSSLPPLDLLAELQRIEIDLGRPREHDFHSPRTIDLDLLYCDNLAFRLSDLELPHPRIFERPFVLFPLLDICPERILARKNIPIRQQCENIQASGISQQDLPKTLHHF